MHASNWEETRGRQLCFFLACLNLWTLRRRQSVPLKHRWNFTGLHGVNNLMIVIILKQTFLPMKSSLFWDIRISRILFATCFMLVSCLALSSTLKMEASCSSEMSVGF
jgi:hypothetical protein